MDFETASSIATGDYEDDDYQYVESGEDGFVKHDITAYYIIVKQLSDKTFWQISYQNSFCYGFEEASVSWLKVRAVKKVVTTWVGET